MNKVIFTEAERAKLMGLDGHGEIVDEAGRPLGYFFSPDAFMRFVYSVANCEVSEAEIAAAREDYRKRGGVTTAEVLAHLKSLEEKGRQAS